MKKDSQRELHPEVYAHLHPHNIVSRNELDAFANDREEVQLLVLAVLKTQAEDQETTMLPAIEASAIAVLAIMLSVLRFDPPGTQVTPAGAIGVIAPLAVGLALSLIAVMIVLPSIRRAVRGNRSRARAAVWLAAYERELDRCRATPGRAGRRWRKNHLL